MACVNNWIVVLMFIIVLFQINTTNAETEISVKAPINPVRLDAMLSLICKVQNLESTHDIAISKEAKDGRNYEALTLDEKIQTEDSRVFLAVRQLADHKVYFLSIINVQREDQGIYKCKLLRKNPTTEIKAHPVMVNITYLPDENPECASAGHLSNNLMEGDTLNWNCSSEEGFPRVSLTWVRSNTGAELPATDHSQNGRVIAELSHTLTRSDNKAIFICKLSSPAFPDIENKKACHIGPIEVKPNPEKPFDNSAYIDNRDDANNRDDGTNNVVSSVDFPTPGSPTIECKEYCSNISTPVFQWIVATILVGILAIIFLIIGIVMSIKLCHLNNSSKSRVVQRRYLPAHGVDDTYAELEGKREDNRVYMMLDRSQIPEMQPLNPNLDREGNYTRTPTATKEITLPTHGV